MKVFIAPKLNKPNTQKTLEAVIAKLSELGIEPVTGELKLEELSACDAVITIGGDGTILKIGKIAARAKKPLLGINTGRLGFMATLESDELDKLERLKNGGYRISRRILLDVVSNNAFDNALNDVVLHRGARSKLPEFIVSRNGTEILRVRADGIIVGTPTGSTAYSLSAGGAIIEPELECVEVTALCPHTLFNRSMIFSGKGRLNVSYADCGGDVFMSVDGGESEILGENQVVEIAQSADYLDLIDIDGNNFYDSIHNKLMKPLK